MKKKWIKYGIPWGVGDTELPYGELKDKFEHLYVLGKSRSGKSTLFLNLIKQHLDYGMIIIDPAGGMSRSLAGLVKDKDRFVYVDKNNPIKINPLTRYSDWSIQARELQEIINNSVMETSSSEAFSVLMRELVRNAVRIMNKTETDLKYLYRFLTYPKIRGEFLKGGDDEYWFALAPYKTVDKKTGKVKYKTSWEFKEKIDSAKRAATRMSEFFDTPLMENVVIGKDEFDPKEIAEQRKIICFNLQGFGKDSMVFMGNLITHAIKSYYENYAEEGGSELFVFIDEFHRYISPNFDDMLTECGKYNISLNLSHHTHKQVTPAVLDAAMECLTKVVFRCGSNEAKRMAQEYVIDMKDFMKLGKYEAMLQISNKVSLIKTYPPPKVNEEQAQKIIKTKRPQEKQEELKKDNKANESLDNLPLFKEILPTNDLLPGFEKVKEVEPVEEEPPDHIWVDLS